MRILSRCFLLACFLGSFAAPSLPAQFPSEHPATKLNALLKRGAEEAARLWKQTLEDTPVFFLGLPSPYAKPPVPPVAWLRRGGPGADFSFCDLRGLDLSGTDLRHALLVRADLRGANLRGANLQHAVLEGARLDGVDATGADFSDSIGCAVEAEKADFSSARFERAYWPYARFTASKFASADFRAAVLNGTVFRDLILEKTIFDSARLHAVLFERVGWNEVMARHAAFIGSAHYYCLWQKSDVSGSVFESTSLHANRVRETSVSAVKFRAGGKDSFEEFTRFTVGFFTMQNGHFCGPFKHRNGAEKGIDGFIELGPGGEPFMESLEDRFITVIIQSHIYEQILHIASGLANSVNRFAQGLSEQIRSGAFMPSLHWTALPEGAGQAAGNLVAAPEKYGESILRGPAAEQLSVSVTLPVGTKPLDAEYAFGSLKESLAQAEWAALKLQSFRPLETTVAQAGPVVLRTLNTDSYLRAAHLIAQTQAGILAAAKTRNLALRASSTFRTNSTAHLRGAVDFTLRGVPRTDWHDKAAGLSQQLGKNHLVIRETLYWKEAGKTVQSAPAEALLRSKNEYVKPDEDPPADAEHDAGSAPADATILQIDAYYRDGKLLKTVWVKPRANGTHLHVQPDPTKVPVYLQEPIRTWNRSELRRRHEELPFFLRLQLRRFFEPKDE